jgi:hypothetical protein
VWLACALGVCVAQTALASPTLESGIRAHQDGDYLGARADLRGALADPSLTVTEREEAHLYLASTLLALHDVKGARGQLELLFAEDAKAVVDAGLFVPELVAMAEQIRPRPSPPAPPVEPAAPPAAPEPPSWVPAADPEPAVETATHGRAPAYVAAGVSIAAVVAAGVFAGLAASAQNGLEQKYAAAPWGSHPQTTTLTQAQVSGQVDQINALRASAWAGGGLAIGAAGAAVFLW